VRGILDGPYADAEKAVLVMDNLNTQSALERHPAEM
jgi:hypothetical protein